MISAGATYIQDLRDKKHKDEVIKAKLQAAEWTEAEIAAAFKELDDPTPPLPPHKQPKTDESQLAADNTQPISVVQRSSTLGVEYGVMFISLAVAAFSIATLAHSYIDVVFGQSDIFNNPLALSGALIGLPLFTLQFIRLQRQEKRQPAIHHDASRRRWVQLTLLVAFLVGMGHIIYYVYNLINGNMSDPYRGMYDYQPAMSPASYQLLQLGHLLITLIISGSIFTFYWRDEHKQK